MSTLGDLRISHVNLDIPMFGAWHADVILERGAPPAAGSRLTLAVVDLVLVGTVLPGQTGEDFASLPHCVLAGGVGWDAPLGPRSYASPPPDGGSGTGFDVVKLSTILRDLATDTGETFAALPADRSVGASYERPGSAPGAPVTGRSVLLGLWRRKMVPAWWIRGDGLTVFGPRPTGPATGKADVMRRDAGVGWKAIGVESPSGFLPGRTIEGATIRRTTVRETGSALTVEAWT